MTARVIQVIEVKFTVGDGSPNNLYREVTKLLTLDGREICEIESTSGGLISSEFDQPPT